MPVYQPLVDGVGSPRDRGVDEPAVLLRPIRTARPISAAGPKEPARKPPGTGRLETTSVDQDAHRPEPRRRFPHNPPVEDDVAVVDPDRLTRQPYDALDIR